MGFCNSGYAGQVSKLDPDMLAFSLLHPTLFEQQGKTKVLFNRPGMIAENSAAEELLMKVERSRRDSQARPVMKRLFLLRL